ncbi:anti-sigma factor domain-containing protein [Bacillus massiliglaciei]|uniref:anti-sigma factor domain-containing protein n=1 Tax=Bacillus massiliglaciei TaxID=1816693 RepID=UPI000A569B5E|nr:anti-sigma factor domain-containing protein [Bacillus massiliglaciei]
MKKGVVLSIDRKFVTVMTPDGEFIKTERRKGLDHIGEEIWFSPRSESHRQTFFKHSSVKVMFAVLAACWILYFTLPSIQGSRVYAYMTIDINPSIELSMDGDMRVIDLQGINADGKQVVNSMKGWKKEDIMQVTEKLAAETKRLGFLDKIKGKDILISTTVKNDEKSAVLEKDMKKISQLNLFSGNELEIIEASEKERRMAREKGVSTGIYVEQKRKNNEKPKTDQIQKEPEAKKSDKKQSSPVSEEKDIHPIIPGDEKNKTAVSVNSKSLNNNPIKEKERIQVEKKAVENNNQLRPVKPVKKEFKKPEQAETVKETHAKTLSKNRPFAGTKKKNKEPYKKIKVMEKKDSAKHLKRPEPRENGKQKKEFKQKINENHPKDSSKQIHHEPTKSNPIEKRKEKNNRNK